MTPPKGRFRTWLRIAHFRLDQIQTSYLELLPYPGLLARPRRRFQRTLGVKVFRGSSQFDSVARENGLAFQPPSNILESWGGTLSGC